MKAAIKTQVVVTPQDDETLHWHSASGAGNGRVEEFAALPESRHAELVLAVPGEKVLLQQVDFAAHERRLLRQTIPFSLEEQLLDDVAAQHFALGPIDGQQVPVAVVERQWLADWLLRCQRAGLDIKHAVPEVLLLPWEPDSWSLRLQGSRWLVRVDRWRGFALEADSAQLALQILLDDAEALPQRLIIWTDATPNENALIEWQSTLPEMLRGIAVLQTLPMAAQPLTTPLDLLQGVFARRLPWQRWLTLWRIPLIAAAVAVLVQFVVAGIQHHQLQKENLALRQQVEQIYRSVEPSGAINDAERQLRRKVQALRGSQGSAVLPTLQRLGGAIKSIDGLNIQTLGYSEKSSEFRLNVVAKSFKDVEALRAAIAKTGLDAQLVGSNADGEKTRAQLRIVDKH